MPAERFGCQHRQRLDPHGGPSPWQATASTRTATPLRPQPRAGRPCPRVLHLPRPGCRTWKAPACRTTTNMQAAGDPRRCRRRARPCWSAVAGLAPALGVRRWLWMTPLPVSSEPVSPRAGPGNLIRNAGAVLLDMNPDRLWSASLDVTIESDGDQLADLHLWRPRTRTSRCGIVSVATGQQRVAGLLLRAVGTPSPFAVPSDDRGD